MEVDSLDNILEEANIEKLDFIIIQLNGAEPNAIEGLTKVKPDNYSIAARYDKSEQTAANIIKAELEKRNYSVQVIKDKYVYIIGLTYNTKTSLSAEKETTTTSSDNNNNTNDITIKNNIVNFES